MKKIFYYRYMKKEETIDFLKEGIIYFNPLSHYKDYPFKNTAIKDENEGIIKNIFENQNNITFEISNGKNTITNKDFQLTELKKGLKEPENFFVYCISKTHNNSLYKDFQVDSCVKIKDIFSFQNRIKNVLPRGFDLSFDDIIYYDPLSEIDFRNFNKPLLCYKENKYRKQSESRFYFYSKYKDVFNKANLNIWLTNNKNIEFKVKINCIKLKLGNLSDICEIISC